MCRKTIRVLLLAFSLGAALCLALWGLRYYSEAKSTRLELERQRTVWNNLKEELQRETAAFSADVAIAVEDLNSGWTIFINEEELFPAASIVKIPIMLVAFSAAAEGRIDLEDKLTLKAALRVGGSGTLKNQPAGIKLGVSELIGLMVSISDNSATNMLIDYLGYDYLNQRFRELGLKNTNISRMMMDFESRARGIENFTTAADLAFILREIYHARAISRAYSEMSLEILKLQKVGDRIPANLPEDISIAHKTGLERGICHDAGIVFTPYGDFIICVLVRHTYKTAQEPKRFIARIAQRVYDYYQQLYYIKEIKDQHAAKTLPHQP